MKLAYTDSNRFLVSNAKNILENAKFSIVLKNEFAVGGVGELSATDSWLELWVSDEVYEESQKILAISMAVTDFPEWKCTHCDEKNEGTFEYCWNCQLPLG